MNRQDRNWTFELGTYWPSEDINPDRDIVVIQDHDRKLRYELILTAGEGKPAIKRVIIDPLEEGGVVNQAILDRMPLGRMAQKAHEYRTGRLRNMAGEPLNMRTPHLSDAPPISEVATLWKQGMGRRELADHYGRSVKAADVWIAKARAQGLIPPAKTGRPKAPE